MTATLRPPAFIPAAPTPPRLPGGRVWARCDLMQHLRGRDVATAAIAEPEEDPFPLVHRLP